MSEPEPSGTTPAAPPRRVERTPEEDLKFRNELVASIPALRAFARGLCGDRELADDLAQEALAKAWGARDSYLPDTHFKAWLFRILRNHYYSQGRRAGRMAAWDEELAERTLISLPGQGAAIDLADMQRGLATLPAEQREALLLVGASGLAYEEVAAIAGCAVGTVKSRVARGRQALLKFMNGPAEARPNPDPDKPKKSSEMARAA